MNFTVKQEQLERLEKAIDENGLSNFVLIQHYVKGKGTFTFRVVCELDTSSSLSGVKAAQEPHKLQDGKFESSESDVCAKCGHSISHHIMEYEKTRQWEHGTCVGTGCRCKKYKSSSSQQAVSK